MSSRHYYTIPNTPLLEGECWINDVGMLGGGGGGLCELLMYEPPVLDLTGCWEPGALRNFPPSKHLIYSGWMAGFKGDYGTAPRESRGREPCWKATESWLHGVAGEQKILWNIEAENRGFF